MDKILKDASPTKGSKSKDKNSKLSSKNVFAPAPTPDTGRNKATSSAELLRAMSGDEESMMLDTAAVSRGAIKLSNDKLVSLTAQSPAQAIIEDNAFLAELHNDEEELSLIQLSLTNYMTPDTDILALLVSYSWSVIIGSMIILPHHYEVLQGKHYLQS